MLQKEEKGRSPYLSIDNVKNVLEFINLRLITTKSIFSLPFFSVLPWLGNGNKSWLDISATNWVLTPSLPPSLRSRLKDSRNFAWGVLKIIALISLLGYAHMYECMQVSIYVLHHKNISVAWVLTIEHRNEVSSMKLSSSAEVLSKKLTQAQQRCDFGD